MSTRGLSQPRNFSSWCISEPPTVRTRVLDCLHNCEAKVTQLLSATFFALICPNGNRLNLQLVILLLWNFQINQQVNLITLRP